MRTKNSFYNTIAQMIYYIINIAFGMINRKILLAVMGVEYQGINGLFSNVLSLLSLAEMGIGTAIIYHLYKPIQENDIFQIKTLMGFYRKCYNIIAIVVFSLGLLVLPFLGFFIGENSLDINFNIVYLLMLFEVLASYLFTYKRSILYAKQRNYIVFIADSFYLLLAYSIQILIIIFTKNYYWYLACKVILRIVENSLLNLATNKWYPYLKVKNAEKLDKAIFDDIVLKVKGTMFHKIGAYVVYGTDNVILSKFFGLLIVGIYSNYSLIITSVTNVFAQIVTSATASVGDLLTYNDIAKNFRIYKELQLFNAFVINMTATCLLCLISPFVSMFFGKEYILSNYIVVVLIINYCLMGMRKVYGVFKDAAGIQYEDRFVPIIEAISNIVFSLIFIKLFGVVGVFLGTTCSYFCIYAYTFPILIYKGLLHKKYIDYVMELLKYFGTFVVSMSISYTLSNMIVLNSSFVKFIISGVICLIVPNILFILIFGRTPEFESLKNRILRLLRIS